MVWGLLVEIFENSVSKETAYPYQLITAAGIWKSEKALCTDMDEDFDWGIGDNSRICMQRGSLEHHDPDNISCPEIIKLRPERDLIVLLIGPGGRYCSDWVTDKLTA